MYTYTIHDRIKYDLDSVTIDWSCTYYRIADVLREVTDRVMTAVRDLVGQARGERPPASFFVPPERRRRPRRADRRVDRVA